MNDDLLKNKSIHIIGGGGVGMSALGMMALDMGITVTASDKNGGVYLDKLAQKGASTWVGANPEKISPQATVFYSSAVPEDDVERVFVRNRAQKEFSRHLLLNRLTKDYYTISVSGTHGKTTTTAWLGYLMETAGFDPTVLAGGTMKNWKSNLKTGRGQMNGKPLLIMEADESDESFLYIDSDVLLITNVELDHVDRYDKPRTFFDKFVQAAEDVHAKGGFVIPTRELLSKVDPKIAYRFEVMKICRRIQIREGRLLLDNEEIFVGPAGEHNLQNASAVLTYAILANISLEDTKKALSTFAGVERRMDILRKGKNSHGAQITIIDDYAHHPTEVSAVLKTLSGSYDRILPVWEPHRISRFLHFEEGFLESFENFTGKNHFYLLPIFDAGGELRSGKFDNDLIRFENLKEQCLGFLKGEDDLPLLLKAVEEARENTAVVFLGAGNSSSLAKKLSQMADMLS